KELDLAEVLRVLRQEQHIETLLVEGGPNLKGQLESQGLMDEAYRTLAMQVIGNSTNPNVHRPTVHGKTSYLPETAPWYTITSVHLGKDDDGKARHLLLRLKYEGPRKFSE